MARLTVHHWAELAAGVATRAANAYLAEVETSINRGTYISPDAGRIRLGDYATRWLAAATMNAPPTSTLP